MSFLSNDILGCINNSNPPRKDCPIEKVLKFVELHIQEFISDVKEAQKENKLNEDNITEILCDVINFNNPPLFWFHFQKSEKQKKGHDKSIDIGVKTRENISVEAKSFSDKDAFFAFEAKRLPLPKTREKEYVIGHYKKGKGKQRYIESGGIERFKTGSHSKELKVAGMLGYVQKDDFEMWHKKINTWIDELVKFEPQNWNKEDKLVEQNSRSKIISKYFSKHQRIPEELSEINLYHLWVKLN